MTGTAAATCPQLQTLRINGVDLSYVDQGHGEAVVVVHGGVSDWRTFGRQIEPFAAHYRFIAYSLRYHWPNAWVDNGSGYTTEQHAQDLIALVLPRAEQRTISDTSHLLHGTNPRAYNETVLAFLAQPPLPAGRSRSVETGPGIALLS